MGHEEVTTCELWGAITQRRHCATDGSYVAWLPTRGFCFAPRRSSGLQLLTYAEVVRVPSTPGGPGQPAPPQTQLHDANIS
ncbi:hypothetical protein J6590_078012, partial [Homalodisca vitripennis]